MSRASQPQTDSPRDPYPAVSEIYDRVTALTPAQCRDALAYLIGFAPLAADLAITEALARARGRQAGDKRLT